MGDWSEYHIIARGDTVTLKINGQVMCQCIDREKGKAARKGVIALQTHAGKEMHVEFRNLRLKLLGK